MTKITFPRYYAIQSSSSRVTDKFQELPKLLDHIDNFHKQYPEDTRTWNICGEYSETNITHLGISEVEKKGI